MCRLIITILMVGCLTVPIRAEEPLESDFFTDTIGSVDQTVSILDYGAVSDDAMDDSAALQAAIDDMSVLPNGGKITIPSGEFYLTGILMKSNVHIEIDAGAILVPPTPSPMIFRFGLDNNGTDAAVTVTNTSIRGIGGRYTVDFSGCPASIDGVHNKVQLAKFMNVKNFMIADFYVIDNVTKMSCLNFGYSSYSGIYYQPENGVIRNGHMTDGHWGYGLIQAQCGNDLFFKDLSGVGGVTLRLETGALLHEPDYIKLDQIYGRNISITNGHRALLMGPHTRNNGHVDVANVTAVSSLNAASAGAGYVTAEEEAAGLTPGSFASSCVISNVYAVYGESAELVWKNFDEIPCAIQDRIASEPAYTNGINVYRGPSSCAVTGSAESGVSWINVTQEGFLHQHDAIMFETDPYAKCNAVPVTDLTLSPTNLSLNVEETAPLSATVSPLDATDSSVSWSSDRPSVVSVSADGLVRAISAGEAMITVTATDGGYTKRCKVSVVAVPTEWECYVNDYGLTGSTSEDEDGDGQSDIMEYALGGNATNASIVGRSPYTISTGTTASFYHLKHTNSHSGITYVAEWTHDLGTGIWSNGWDASVSGTSTNAGFDEAEYRLDWGMRSNLFFRLRISQP